MFRIRLGTLLAIFFILLFGSSIAGALVFLITDRWWFESIGYDSIFLTVLKTKLILGFTGGGIAFLFLFCNLAIAAFSRVPWVGTLNIEKRTVQRLLVLAVP